jgi:hypothetical protein
MSHVYSDTGSDVEPHTCLSSYSQPVEIFQKFINSELVNFIVNETDANQQKCRHIRK